MVFLLEQLFRTFSIYEMLLKMARGPASNIHSLDKRLYSKLSFKVLRITSKVVIINLDFLF